MEGYRGIDYLRNKLKKKKRRNETRYRFYEMKNRMKDFNITTPKEFRAMKECIGWCTKSVDVIADRLSFREFSNDIYQINEIYNMNNPDILFDSAIISALITLLNRKFSTK